MIPCTHISCLPATKKAPCSCTRRLHINHSLYNYIATKTVTFTPTPQVPALQYIGNVEPGGSADLAGLKTGDFLLEVCTVHTYIYKYVHVYTLYIMQLHIVCTVGIAL